MTSPANSRTGPLLLLAGLALLIGGFAGLIYLRFASGEAYPPGSSLRADPLGTKALFDSYRDLPGLGVDRNFTPFNEHRGLPEGAALLLPNANGARFHRLARFDAVRDFITGGGRLVIALNPRIPEIMYPYYNDDSDEDEDESVPEDKPEADNAGPADDPDPDAGFEPVPFRRAPRGEDERALWAGLTLLPFEAKAGYAFRNEQVVDRLLPLALPWRAGGRLTGLGEDWTPLYELAGETVAAARTFGDGEIIVLTDAYLLSNEALLMHREPGFLAWLPGGRHLVIFDETHLGVASQTGIAVLVRRYRLGGFVLTLAAVLGLVVWRGSLPLLPPHPGRAAGNTIRAELSSEAGLASLLSRGVSESELPETAFRLWKRSFIRNEADRRRHAALLREVEELLAAESALPPRRRNPRETHLKIHSILNRHPRTRL
ncbi:MAG: hypothetical protein EA425_12120 [Puniceicoccaceae bacterium]|nr:MAG: hypothetical protein EA425_12120 [Puniceicoccaceae bacterium]